jgi:thiosulfate reductase cytochrome b subunit
MTTATIPTPTGDTPRTDRHSTGPRGPLFTPWPVRLWHWLNAVAILALIFTALQLRFPDHLKLLAFRRAVMVHNWAGIATVVLLAFWAAYYGFAHHRLFAVFRLYVPSPAEIWPGLLRQARFYAWGYFLGEEHPYPSTPENKFNPMQKLFYALLMFVVMPLLCVTGLVLLNVTPLRIWLTEVGGVKLVVGLHFLLAAFVVMFLFIHLYLSTLGETFWSGFATMITGREAATVVAGRLAGGDAGEAHEADEGKRPAA